MKKNKTSGETCRRFREALTEYLDRSLPASREQHFSRHLEKCASCREVHQRARRLLVELRAIGHVPVPGELAWSIKRTLERERRPRRGRSALRPIPFALAAGVAATTLFALTLHLRPLSPVADTVDIEALAPLETTRLERYVSPASVSYRLPPDVTRSREYSGADRDTVRAPAPSRIEQARPVRFPF